MNNQYFEDDECEVGVQAAIHATLVPTNPVEKFYAQMRSQDSATMRRCVEQEIAQLGFLPATVREDSRIWDKARTLVANNLIQANMTFADIEFGDETVGNEGEGADNGQGSLVEEGTPKKARLVKAAS